MKKLVLLFFIGAFISCSADKKEKDREIISQLEKTTISDVKAISYEKADSLVNAYLDYVKTYPEDSLCATYLYRAADVYANTKRCVESIKMYDRLIKQYPDNPLVEQSYFLKGVVFSQTCLNKEMAKEAFEEFMKKYPSSPLYSQAQMLLIMDTMKDEMDLIRQFEQKNQ